MTIAHSPAHIIAAWLIESGVFTAPEDSEDWPVYIGSMPDGRGVPDSCAAIYDVVGLKDGRLMAGANILHHGVQIRVRTRVYADGWEKGQEVTEALAAAALEDQVIIDDSIYALQNVSQQETFTPVGYEESPPRRAIFTVNYLATLVEGVLMLTGDISTVSHPSGVTLEATSMQGQYHSNSGAGAGDIILSLPPAADGLSGWFVQVDTGVLEINPQNGDSIYWSGIPAALAAGESLKLKQQISAVFLYSDGNNRWVALSPQGTVIPDSED